MERLNLDSTLADLHLHHFVADADCLGFTIYQAFEENPVLPGVVLVNCGVLQGLVSRRRFLEAISRTYGRELFFHRPMKLLLKFVAADALVFCNTTPIAVAAQQAIARPVDLLYEPIVVEATTISGSDYYLVDTHTILQAQSTIHQLTAELLKEKTRSEMMQTEKMASLGKMMAGVAHEIRNPVNFIWGNLKYIAEYTADLSTLIHAFEQEIKAPSPALRELQESIDVPFILDDLPKVVQSMETGIDRLRNLVTSLRTFSRMDEVKQYPTDLHQSLDSTLLILNNRLKAGITVRKEYGDLPEVLCCSGQIGQVFMNIISNAIDALLEYDATLAKQEGLPRHNQSGLPLTKTRPWEPCITIQTTIRDRLPEDTPSHPCSRPAIPGTRWAAVIIRDNGPGIPKEIQAKVFEDFFTTKAAGDGTGLGLPITQQIVREKHDGHLILRSPWLFPGASEPGRGTEFEILLPIFPKPV